MAKTLTVSRQKPKIVAWGRPSLEPGVERYVLNGGGTGVYALESDDVIEIALLEGAQTVEMLSFGANGKSNLASLGLTGRGSATDIQKILADDSDDAARVRFELSAAECTSAAHRRRGFSEERRRSASKSSSK